MNKYKRQIYAHSSGVLRIECLPENEKDLPCTFAVPDTKGFHPVEFKREEDRISYSAKGISIELIDDKKGLHDRNLSLKWNLHGTTASWSPGDLITDNLGGISFALDHYDHRIDTRKVIHRDPMDGFDAQARPFYGPLDDGLKLLKGLDEYKELSEKELKVRMTEILLGKLEAPNRSIQRLVEQFTRVPQGLINRSGITILRDDSLVINSASGQFHRSKRSDIQILYIATYGKDIRKGLKQFQELLGSPPKVPERFFMTWFSCYKKWGHSEWEEVVKEFKKNEFPLGTISIDTDWHEHFWWGFQWNRELFPDPEAFRDWKERESLTTFFNVHPGALNPKEEDFDLFLKVTDSELSLYTENNTPTPFHLHNQPVDYLDANHRRAWFDIFHHKAENYGCDYWWVDGSVLDDDEENATSVLIEDYYKRSLEKEEEPFPVLARNHGLGSHRSTCLFTGDTNSNWETLEKEVASLSYAANSLCPYVSHDIGGFFGLGEDRSEEKLPVDMYIRWSQFGALSPVLRWHSVKGVREPWNYGSEAARIVKEAVHLRYALIPYFYQLSIEAHKTGVSICRPLYYHSDDERCFDVLDQYLIGSKLLVAPVVKPSLERSILFPEGDWVSVDDNTEYEGGQRIDLEIPMSQIPVFIRKGSEIPVYLFADASLSWERKEKRLFSASGSALMSFIRSKM